MSATLWWMLLGMSAVTFLTRASFIVFGQRLRFPPILVQALTYVPIAVLTAIIAPEALMPRGTLNLLPTNPHLMGALVAGLIAWKSGRVLTAVFVGFAVFEALRWLSL